MKIQKYNRDILNDDVIKYISQRHNTTARDILEYYSKYSANDKKSLNKLITLESNEIQIIKDLINFYSKHNYE